MKNAPRTGLPLNRNLHPLSTSFGPSLHLTFTCRRHHVAVLTHSSIIVMLAEPAGLGRGAVDLLLAVGALLILCIGGGIYYLRDDPPDA